MAIDNRLKNGFRLPDLHFTLNDAHDLVAILKKHHRNDGNRAEKRKCENS
ncbi:hypothetical protein [Parasphingorhabdus sp.]